MVRFIYGNPGTGKTQLIYSFLEKDAAEGKNAILIVPEQMTVAAERDVVKLLPPSAQLNIEVLNFSRLANKLFRIHGGLAYNYVSSGLQKLIMWRALHTALPFLSEYRVSSSDDSSLSDAMLATYKEITAGGISFESLDNISKANKGSLLSNKLKDISTVCSVYSAMLSDKYTDSNNELERLADLLEDTQCLKGYSFYLDGFTSFTGLEHKIIKLIMAQADVFTVTVGLPSPSYDGIDTLSLKQCSDRLRRDTASLGFKFEIVSLTENRRAQKRELAYLSSELWEIDSETTFECNDSDHSVELFRAADVYDECEFAASKIRQLVESGYRYKDIAIIARNIDKYKGIIEPALDNMELRYFISEKTDLSVSPIARLILSALKIVNYGWKRGDVIAHLKTGLCNISPHDADIFESYSAKWNINGRGFTTDEPWSMNPDGFTTVWSERGTETLRIANEVKSVFIGNLKSLITDLKSAQTYTEMCLAIVNYLELLDVRGSLIELATRYLSDNKFREASDCAKLYDTALEALDCVCDAFPDDVKPDIITLATALKISFSESDLGSIPTSQDEIMIGSANMLRTDNIKCAVILGACDGEFPAGADNAGLLTDIERSELISLGVQISGDSSIKASDELYYFRRAVAAPSEKLIIFTRADSEPSIAFTKISNIFNHVGVKDTTSLLIPRLRSLPSIREYAQVLKDTPEGEAIIRLLEDLNGDEAEGCSSYRDIALDASTDFVNPQVLHSVLGTDLRISQSKIEQYTNCKFAYSCKYYLSLNDSDRAEFAYNSIGTFIHYVLEKFLFRVFVIEKGICPEADKIDEIIDEIIDSYINDLFSDKNKKSARLMHLVSRLKKTSKLIIDDLMNEFSDSSFKPEFFELRVGSKDVPSIKLQLKNGSSISLNGVIDRVDVFRDGENVYVRVVDYKTGSKTFSVSDISDGLNLQLLLYIFSLTKQKNKNIEKLFGGKPVAGAITYLSAASAKVKAERISDPGKSVSNAIADIKRTGLILDNDSVIEAISHSGDDRLLMKTARKNSFIDLQGLDMLYDTVCGVLTEIGNTMMSGNINAVPKAGSEHCKYCKYSFVCKASWKS